MESEMSSLAASVAHDMFHMQLPIIEKILRPVIVYLCLIAFLRLFGKRELAQLNPFDLVVLLSLSNTVQNAMIGDDNSLSGGIIGAFSLLTINWMLTWVLFRSPKLDRALEGSPTVLIRGGVVDEDALRKECLTHEELITALNKNNFSYTDDVDLCVLEPSGTFYVLGKHPSSEESRFGGLLAEVKRLGEEIRQLRQQLETKS
jgi:uncharacterized membrane protein YcaP (DUF421 family)